MQQFVSSFPPFIQHLALYMSPSLYVSLFLFTALPSLSSFLSFSPFPVRSSDPHYLEFIQTACNFLTRTFHPLVSFISDISKKMFPVFLLWPASLPFEFWVITQLLSSSLANHSISVFSFSSVFIELVCSFDPVRQSCPDRCEEHITGWQHQILLRILTW